MKRSSLNHVFRSIWSDALNTFVAVSEITMAKGKRSKSCVLDSAALAVNDSESGNIAKPNRRLRLKSLVFILACSFGLQAQANPTGAQVVSGAANIKQSGSLLTVTNSPNAIINWQGFSIGAGQTTNFIQQSASSSVLNRVVGPDPSSLLGTLTSNGRVFLINLAGILVGQGARIDVGSFISSTLNLSNADFLAGKLNFQATSPSGDGVTSVINNGTITTPEGGSVYLVAPQVENNGIINTPKGETILAAGNTVQIVDTGAPGVSVQITGSNTTSTNLGQILADSGQIGVVGAVVKNSGTISANSLVNQGGRVFLKATNTVDAGGTISAQGATGGGNISVLADTSNGTVNVTGTLDASVPSSSVPSPNGGGLGRGSTSKGAATTPNGGQIETSAAHVQIADSAHITTAAANGKSGTWLIDPLDYYIAAADPSPGNDSWMSNTQLGSSLTNNGSVIIQTLTGTGNGDIFVNNPVNWTSSSSLTLTAARNILISASVNGGTTGSVVLNAAGTISEAVGGGITASSLTTNAHGGTSLIDGQTQINGNSLIQPSNSVSYFSATDTGTVLFGNTAALLTLGPITTGGTLAVLNAGNTTIASPISINGIGLVPGLTPALASAVLSAEGTGAMLTNNSTISLASGGNGLALVGQKMTLSGGSISVPASGVALHATGGVAVDLGSTLKTTANTLELSQADLATINSPTLQIVANNNINISAPINVGSKPLLLNANDPNNSGSGSISEAAGGSITAGALTTNSLGGTILTGANTVTSFNATNTSSGNISLTNTATILSIAGISQSVSYDEVKISNTGVLELPTSGVITTAGGNVKLNASGTLNVIGSINVNGYSNVNGYIIGTVSLRADSQGTCVSSSITCNEVNFSGAVTGGTTNIYYNPTSSYNSTRASTFIPSYNGASYTYTGNINGALNTYMLVNDVLQLQAINLNQSTLAGLYALGKNIDASATVGWNGIFAPIGGNTTSVDIPSFTGTFDGLYNTINNLHINQPSNNYVGLFGYTSSTSTIRNVTLTNATVSGGNNVGGLVGYNNSGNIVNNTVNSSTVSGTNNVGGLVGYNSGMVGYNYGSSVNSSTVSGTNNVGGLVGYNSGTINNSFVNSTTVSGSANVGGLVGGNYGGAGGATTYAIGTAGSISSSYVSGGSVNGTGNNVGGLVGLNSGGSGGSNPTNYGGAASINYSHAYGVAVTGSSYVGGLVGANIGGKGGNNSASNGLGAAGGVANISNSYAYGVASVTGSNNVGGLVGANMGGNGGNSTANYGGGGAGAAAIITNSYVSGMVVTGATNVGGLVGLNSGGNGSDTLANTIQYVTGGAGGAGGAAKIGNSYVTGMTVTGTANNVGGLVGNNSGGLGGSNAAYGGLAGAGGKAIISGANNGTAITVTGLVSPGSITYSYASNVTVSGASNVGGLVGLNSGAAGGINSANTTYAGGKGGAGGVANISYSYVSGGTVSGTATSSYVGGLVGENSGGAGGNNTPTNNYAGGTGGAGGNAIITVAYADGGTVSGSTANGTSYVGGLVGLNSVGVNGVRTNAVGTGGIGGLAPISNSYVSNSTVTGGNIVGGLVGVNYGSINNTYTVGGTVIFAASSMIGGLVGENFGTVSNSYSSNGVVCGSGSYCGGVVGYNSAGTVSNTFWDSQVANGVLYGIGFDSNNSGPTNTNATGLSTAHMMSASSLINLLGTTVTLSVAGLDGTLVTLSSGSTANLAVGESISGSGFPLGTTITSIATNGTQFTTSVAGSVTNVTSLQATSVWFMVDGNTRPFLQSEWSTAITNTHQLQLMTMDPTQTYNLQNDINFSAALVNGGMWNTAFSLSNASVSGGTTVTLNSGTTANLAVGESITGDGFQSGTTIASITNSTTFVTSQADTNSTATGITLQANANPYFAGSSGFVPVGNLYTTPNTVNNTPFSGSFNGQSHLISNLIINRPLESQVGLFGVIGTTTGLVSSVTLDGAQVTGLSNVGSLVGFNNWTVTGSYVSGSTVSATLTGGSVTGGLNVGGLVGYNNGTVTNSTVTGSTVSGTVRGGSVTGGLNVGGLVGYNYGTLTGSTVSGGTVSGTVSGGSVTGGLNVGALNVGGLVGFNYGTLTGSTVSGGTVSGTVSGGSVTGGLNVGGLVGFNTSSINSSQVLNNTAVTSYVSGGTVTGNLNIGGLVGDNTSTISGSNASVLVTGNVVSGNAYIGDLAGSNSGTIIGVNTSPLILGTINVGGASNLNIISNDVLSITGTLTGGTVYLSSPGTITESGAGLISTGTLHTSSVGGTTLTGLNNTISSFNATNTGGGAISLTNIASLTLTGITNSATGSVFVNNTGSITVSGALGAGTGGVTLNALGAAGDITSNADIISTGDLSLFAARNIALNAGDNYLGPITVLHNASWNPGMSHTYYGSYASTGNVELLAGGNFSILNTGLAVLGNGNATIMAGWNGASTSAPAVTAFSSGKNLTLNGGIASLGTGNITLVAADAVNIKAISNSSAGIDMNSGTLSISADKIYLAAYGLSGASYSARIFSNGIENFSVGMAGDGGAGILSLAGGGAGYSLTGGAGYGGEAGIYSFGTTGSQNFTFNNGSSLVLKGGSGNGLAPVTPLSGNCSSVAVCSSNFAYIDNEATGGQSFTFTSGGNLALTGGSAGNNNFARINNLAGTQTINVNPLTGGPVTGSPAISLIGGISGGYLYTSGGTDYYFDNSAGITSATSLIVNASAITLTGGSAAYGRVYLSAPTQTIATTGNLSLNGGSAVATGFVDSGGNASSGAMIYTDSATMGYAASNATLSINVGGNLTFNGGPYSSLYGGSWAGMGSSESTANITITATGNVSLAGANQYADRIGSHLGLGGTVSITSTNGYIDLGEGTVGTGATLGSVTLAAGTLTPGAGYITENTLGKIVTPSLSTSANTGTTLVGGANAVASFAATDASNVELKDNGDLISSAATLTLGPVTTGGTLLVVNNGNLTVAAPIAINGTGTVAGLPANVAISGVLQAGGANGGYLITNDNTISLASGGKGLLLVADQMTLAGSVNSRITAPASGVYLNTLMTTDLTDLGTTAKGTAGTLQLSQADLSTISSPVIGLLVNNNINITAPINVGTSTLSLVANAPNGGGLYGSISETGSGSITAGALLTSAGIPTGSTYVGASGTTLNGANAVGAFSASDTGVVSLINTASSLGLNSISSNGVTVSSSNDIVVNAAVNAGTGALNLTAGRDLIQSAGGLTCSGMTLSAGRNLTLTASNSGALPAYENFGQSGAGGVMDVSNFTGMNSIQSGNIGYYIAGGAGSDTLIGVGGRTVTITGANSGTIGGGAVFNSVENFNGGSGVGNATFIFSGGSLSGSILSGTGAGVAYISGTTPGAVNGDGAGVSSVSFGDLTAASINIVRTTGVTLTGAINTGTGAVTLLSSGTIIEGASGSISASALTTSAAGGTNLNGANAVGSFSATDTAGVILNNVATTLNLGPISSAGLGINNTGAVVVGGAITEGSGNVAIQASSSLGENASTGSIATTGLLATFAAGGTTLGGANAVGSFTATDTGAVSLTNTAASLTLGAINSAGLTVNNTGAVVVGGAITEGAGNIGLAASSTIVETTSTGSVATTGTLTTSSVGGTSLVGSGGNTVGTFNGSNTTSGIVELTNTASTLSITGINNTAGNVTLNNTGIISIAGTIAAGTATVNSSAGSIESTLSANQTDISAGSLQMTAYTGIGNASTPLKLVTGNLNATTTSGGVDLINTPTGAVTLVDLITGDNSAISYSQIGQNLNLTGTVSSVNGNILIDPPANVTMNSAASISSGGGSIGLQATGDVVLATINAGSGSAAGAINLTAGGNVSSALAPGVPNLVGGIATINVGGNAFFNTSVQTLNVTVGGAYSISDGSIIFSSAPLAVQQLINLSTPSTSTSVQGVGNIQDVFNLNTSLPNDNYFQALLNATQPTIGNTSGSFGGCSDAGLGACGDTGNTNGSSGNSGNTPNTTDQNNSNGKTNAKPNKC